MSQTEPVRGPNTSSGRPSTVRPQAINCRALPYCCSMKKKKKNAPTINHLDTKTRESVFQFKDTGYPASGEDQIGGVRPTSPSLAA